jgi:hypothetical protein
MSEWMLQDVSNSLEWTMSNERSTSALEAPELTADADVWERPHNDITIDDL